MLNKNLGDVLPTPADDGTTKPVRIDGLLQDSVFQSGLLLSEREFPRSCIRRKRDINFFLIASPPGKEGEVESC